MINFEHTQVFGWEAAIRGMRNPMNSWEKSDTLLTERPRINYCTQDEADLWSGRANASDGLSEPLGGIPDEEEF